MTYCDGRLGEPYLFFLQAVVPLYRPIRALDSVVIASSPKHCSHRYCSTCTILTYAVLLASIAVMPLRQTVFISYLSLLRGTDKEEDTTKAQGAITLASISYPVDGFSMPFFTTSMILSGAG